jgi:hypothetical protein
MICPKCGGSEMRAWHYWDGGGHRGVECVTCKTSFWSDSIAAALADAVHAAELKVVADLPFPSDGVSDEDKELDHEGCPHDCAACDRSIRYMLDAMNNPAASILTDLPMEEGGDDL